MQRIVKSGVQVIHLPEADLKKLNARTIPQRDRWGKDMQARGMDGASVLKTALHYPKEK